MILEFYTTSSSYNKSVFIECFGVCLVLAGAIKGFSIWIILSAALGSSVVLLVAMGTFRYIMQERGLEGMDSDGLDFEATPHDMVCLLQACILILVKLIM
jgi:hypothetical protein